MDVYESLLSITTHNNGRRTSGAINRHIMTFSRGIYRSTQTQLIVLCIINDASLPFAFCYAFLGIYKSFQTKSIVIYIINDIFMPFAPCYVLIDIYKYL